MAIIREPVPKDDFFVAPRIFTRDLDIPFEAIGLLSVLYSLPANWEYSASGLATVSMHGKNRISKLMRLLVEKGYVEMVQLKTPDGKFAGKTIRLKNNIGNARESKQGVQSPSLQNTALQTPSPHTEAPVDEAQYNIQGSNRHEDKIHQSINLGEDEIDEIREEVKDQIDYDYACKQFGKDRIDGIVDIMVEVLLSVSTVNIGRNQIPAEQVKNVFRKIDMNHLGYIFDCKLPAEQVKNVFRKINMDHLEYIFDCIEETSREKKIRNMKSYLMTALYNAPMTMDVYYDSDYNYDSHNGGEE